MESFIWGTTCRSRRLEVSSLWVFRVEVDAGNVLLRVDPERVERAAADLAMLVKLFVHEILPLYPRAFFEFLQPFESFLYKVSRRFKRSLSKNCPVRLRRLLSGHLTNAFILQVKTFPASQLVQVMLVSRWLFFFCRTPRPRIFPLHFPQIHEAFVLVLVRRRFVIKVQCVVSPVA